MKNKLSGLSLIITLVTTPISALANDKLAAGSEAIDRKIANITPVDLVDSAYQGQFSDLGIPSYLTFVNAVKTNRIDSQVLVESAVQSGRLELDVLSDRTYLNRVQDLLELKAKDN